MVILKLVCLYLSKLEFNHQQLTAMKKAIFVQVVNQIPSKKKAIRQLIVNCHSTKEPPSFIWSGMYLDVGVSMN